MDNSFGKLSKENEGYQVAFKRILNHPIEKVWQAITDPEQLRYWFTDIEMDFRAGGKITIRFRDKDRSLSYGEIVSIEPPTKFVWTWEGELAVWELKKLDEKTTELKFTYSRLSEDYAINAPAGFHSLLDRLEKRLAGSAETYPFGTEGKEPEHLELQRRYAEILKQEQ